MSCEGFPSNLVLFFYDRQGRRDGNRQGLRRKKWRTEVGRIVVAGTDEAHGGQEGHDGRRRSAVDAPALGQQVQSVELFKEARRRLMDGADHRAAALGQPFQQRDALHARRAVQPAAASTKPKKKTDRASNTTADVFIDSSEPSLRQFGRTVRSELGLETQEWIAMERKHFERKGQGRKERERERATWWARRRT